MRISRVKLIVIYLAIFLLALSLVYIFYGEDIKKYIWDSNSPINTTSYDNADLSQIYSQSPNLEVKTKQTAEQTYQKFREQIKVGEVEQALSLFADKYKDKYRTIFNQAKQDDKLDELYSKLDSRIKEDKANCYLTKCGYVMSKSGAKINFVKNEHGAWLIEAL